MSSRLGRGEMKELCIKMINDRGVEIIEIAEITLILQKKYIENLSLDTCLEHVYRVLSKREVQHAILTGIEIDVLAEQGKLSEPLSSIVLKDEGLFGLDEILALSIVNVYGSIGLTNFGYVDKEKIGVIKRVDEEGKTTDMCHTFLDDIIGAIAASAASSIAHKYV